MNDWRKPDESLPPDETPVLVIHLGEIKIGELRWEYPGHEDTYEAFRYWDAPHDDGQSWEWSDITFWMSLPKLPEASHE